MTNNQRPGIRQQQILDTMHHNGGYWPPHHRIRSDHRHIFETLSHRGLIVRAYVGRRYTWKLATATNKAGQP